tara:strand:- start:125 stop:439 length:315 start_codon:yes stop_codon:yes gene_type:complete
MAKVIKATMSEWHQVERKYTLHIDVPWLVQAYNGHQTEEECQEIFDQLASGDLLVEDLEEDLDDVDWMVDWAEQDTYEDDWWTMRKGGFDVTYSQAPGDNEEPE